MKIVVQDIDRPDINGKPPKMKEIGDRVRDRIKDLAPLIRVTTDDNICSAVMITGSLDPQEQWINEIYHNSRYFQFSVRPEKNKRYYEVGDRVTVELFSGCHKISTKFRKYTSTPDKAIDKLEAWIVAAMAES